MNLTSVNSMTAMMPQGMNLSQADKAKIADTAEDFEAFFISRMMESMYEGVSTDGMFGGGNAERMYRSLLLNEYGKQMAKTGTVGVKDDIMRSIIEMQEMQSQGYIEGK
ncbi:MAG: rod-binding protein [Alphaproteobacteria bacterium]|nr:rod-binding protein [Alphaproteobacteria bacterium]